ncbi:6986_t:CDS:1, partial [Paraglomus brasilianum]
PKINEETNISEINENVIPQSRGSKSHDSKNRLTAYSAIEIPNTSSLIESNAQIPIGGIETIPTMTSTLMSPLSAYIFLALLIIAVVWFVRRTWGFERKSKQLQNIWVGY